MDGPQAITVVAADDDGCHHGRGRAAARRITTEGDAYDGLEGEADDVMEGETCGVMS
jgi:hypothetical protein